MTVTSKEGESISKRALDVVLALVAIAMTSPLWPVVALLTKLQDGGPVFYRQQRWGRGGVIFEVRKFRTMTVSESQVIEQSAEDDARVTRIGRVLRRMGLDELPQLVSILKGDMSFVGPRPLAVGEVVRTAEGTVVAYEGVPGFSERLRVKPGLTGPTTIYMPRDASPQDKFASDLAYIDGRSLWGDVKLILLSVVISLRGRWESRSPKT